MTFSPNPPRTTTSGKKSFDKSLVQRPRARLLVGGQVVAVHSARVTSNNYFAADTWSAVVALGPDVQRGVDFWGSQDEFEVELLFGFIPDGAAEGAADWKSLLTGKATRIRINRPANTVTLDGRDFTGDLIETQIVDSYANMKASDIAIMFAKQHNLTADVDPTDGFVGKFYEHSTGGVSTAEFSHASNQWDLLCFLAQQYEGYATWVRGRTLHFKKYTDSSGEKFLLQFVQGKVTSQPGGTVNGCPVLNSNSVEVERDMTRAKDIEVVVRSWSGNHAGQFQVIARRSKAVVPAEKVQRGKAAGTDPLAGLGVDEKPSAKDNPLAGLQGFSTPGPAQHNDTAPPPAQKGVHRYIIERAGLTHEAALELAQAKLLEATLHERKITVEMPGELDLEPRRMVTLAGYGAGWDQDYYVFDIVRNLSEKGLTESVTAKNESPGGVTKITTSA
jgi:phage protein D